MLRELALLPAPADGAPALSSGAIDRYAEVGAALARIGALPSPEDGSCARVVVEVKRP
jgi:hypothetical protein